MKLKTLSKPATTMRTKPNSYYSFAVAEVEPAAAAAAEDSYKLWMTLH